MYLNKKSLLMFEKAIVRRPGKSLVNGISESNQGQPDYEKALKQHEEYKNTLRKCGLKIIELEPDEQFPDSTFVEDTAVITRDMAILANPAPSSRKDEVLRISEELKKHWKILESIKEPGKLEGGDVMQIEMHFYVGISERTNEEGARQFDAIVRKYGYTSSAIKINNILHLKTGINYLGDKYLLMKNNFLKEDEFEKFKMIQVSEKEAYAANSLRINEYVIVPAGYPETKKKIENEGFKTMVVNLSEFKKLDGGLSCLSLRV